MRMIQFVVMALCVAAWGCSGFNPVETITPGPVGPGGPAGQVEVIIEYPSGKPDRVVLETAGNPTVLDVTRRVARVATDFAPSGEQEVVAIGGIKNDPRAAKLWVYEINGIVMSAAPNLKYVTNGDSVRWRYR